MTNDESIEQLLGLSHQLGLESRALAMLGEGNTSVRLDADTFAVKASGHNLASLTGAGVSVCRFADMAALLSRSQATDAEVDQALLDGRVSATAPKPSVEAMFHAWLLSLPDVSFVGHTHPVAVNRILCAGRGAEFAGRRMFPDEIVCCGGESVLVPYTDPGLKLAQAIRDAVTAFIDRTGAAPRVILLENHGMIALGGSAKAVLATTLMAAKAADIFAGAAALGGPVFLTPEQVARIAGRPDEHYRRRALGL